MSAERQKTHMDWRRLLMVLALAGCATPGAELHGPMPVRPQHPAQLTVLRLRPETLAVAPDAVAVRWTNAYSSLFLSGQDLATGNSFAMDGEYWRTALGARFGLGGGVSVDVELPFGHTTGGGLDQFVIDWHNFFGFPNRGRDTAAKDQFSVRAERSGQAAWSVEERSFELLDIPLEVSWAFLEPPDQRGFGAGVRFGVELPTGDDAAGFGSGELDVALGATSAYRGDRWGVWGNLEHAFAGTPSSAKARGLRFRDVTSGSVAFEGLLNDWLAALVQVSWATSTLRGLAFDRVADDQWNLWTGGRVMLADRSSLDITIGEDLSAFVAPDFTIWIALHHTFGAR